ncbi:MAG TPA: hypothetical protein VM097_05000 [Mycobacteriales bacterium]|nr:hypothetical protein [Mycobacteriales bacterium]
MLAGQVIPEGCEFRRADVDQERHTLGGEIVSFVAKPHQGAWRAESVALSADPSGDVARLRRQRQMLMQQVVMMDDDD